MMGGVGVTIADEEAVALDAADPLAGWRDEFLIPDPRVVYLDGNSLGMTPRRTIERVEALMRDEWAGGLIGSWEHWIDLPQRVGDTLAGIIGAGPGEVVVHDSVTINLYQLVHAALALRPDRRVIAVAAGEFPTDRYVVDSIARSTGCEVRHGFERLDDVAVAVRSLVDYRTAEVADLVGRDRPRRRRRRAADLGPVARRRAARRRPARSRRPTGRRLHLQVPERWPRLAGLLVRRRRSDRTDRAADLGLVQPGRPVRDGSRLRPPTRHRAAARSARRASSG